MASVLGRQGKEFPGTINIDEDATKGNVPDDPDTAVFWTDGSDTEKFLAAGVVSRIPPFQSDWTVDVIPRDIGDNNDGEVYGIMFRAQEGGNLGPRQQCQVY